MRVQFTCPSCGTVLEAPAQQLGTMVSCRRCRRVLYLKSQPAPTAAPKRPRGLAWALSAVAALALLAAVGAAMYLALPRGGPSHTPKSSPPAAVVVDNVPNPVPPPPKTEPPPDATPPTHVETPPLAVAPADPPKPPPADPPKPPPSDPPKLPPPDPPKPPPPDPPKPPPPDPPKPPPSDPPSQPPPAPPADGVVIYPADGQKHVPPSFPGNEVPDPIPEAHGAAAGYPVTASFPLGVAVRKARATMRDDGGNEVEAWASSPEKPAAPGNAWAQENTICIIAKKPLAPATTYSIRMSAEADGKPWSRAWTFTTAGEGDGNGRAIDVLVKRLNDYRKAAGLEPLTADPDLSAPCQAHAVYLARNTDAKDLNWNDEAENLPGYSADGRRVARRSSVNAGAGPEAMTDWAVASFIPRELLLEPGLRKLGVGAAPFVGGGFWWVIDSQGERPQDRDQAGVVLFPGPDQKGVPTAYPPGEEPGPVPEPDAKTPGYAVTVRFPPRTAVEGVEAKITDDAGKEVEAFVSTPAHPAIRGVPQHCIGLIPKNVLRPDVKYTVEMSAKVGGEAWQRKWSFRTAGESDDADALAAAAVETLNGYRRAAGVPPVTLDEKRSKACRLHARYLARNIDAPAVQGLGMHDEDMSLPGATAEGRRAGKASVISRLPDPSEVVDGWIDTLFHRIPLLSPDLKKVGYACVRLPDQSWIVVMDSEPGK
jgi:uncharacterized protein YkwD